MIADYAVILTIIMFVAFDNYYGLATPKLIVPTIFKVCFIQLIPFFFILIRVTGLELYLFFKVISSAHTI